MYKLNFIPTQPGERAYALSGDNISVLAGLALAVKEGAFEVATLNDSETIKKYGVDVEWGEEYTEPADEHEGEQTLWEASGLEEA